MNERSRRGNIKQHRVKKEKEKKKKQAYATFMETAYFVLFSSFFVQAIQDETLQLTLKLLRQHSAK